MDTGKFYEFFQPEKCRDRIHIIGCGATGSTIAELLARTGLTKFTLWDDDVVEPHNIANQIYRQCDIGERKTEALAKIMKDINPDVDIKLQGRYEAEILNGYVFMTADSVNVWKNICKTNQGNIAIKAMFNTRIRLTDAQGYAARWDDYKEVENLLKSMDFTDEEAQKETPMSACNLALSIAPTVRLICNLLVADFINLFTNKDNWKTVFIVDSFSFNLSTF